MFGPLLPGDILNEIGLKFLRPRVCGDTFLTSLPGGDVVLGGILIETGLGDKFLGALEVKVLEALGDICLDLGDMCLEPLGGDKFLLGDKFLDPISGGDMFPGGDKFLDRTGGEIFLVSLGDKFRCLRGDKFFGGLGDISRISLGDKFLPILGDKFLDLLGGDTFPDSLGEKFLDLLTVFLAPLGEIFLERSGMEIFLNDLWGDKELLSNGEFPRPVLLW